MKPRRRFNDSTLAIAGGLCLTVSFFAGLFPCEAASSLIAYERLRYLDPPPNSMSARGLSQGRDGRIFGTVHSRGSYAGMLFGVNPDGTDYTVILSSTTNRPSGVIEGRDGSLYGTIAGGPVTNVAAVFRVDRDGSNFTLLRSFSPGRPLFGVIQDGEGWLYGTTVVDGTQGQGTVYRMATNGNGYEVLYSFAGAANQDGSGPGALTIGADGLLYGCTFFGGSFSNHGTVFRLGRDGSGYAVLHRFGGDVSGHFPAADQPLRVSEDGYVYGTADGGLNRAGIIFRLGQNGGDFHVIHQFEGRDETGDSPIGGLVEWCDGTLYGTTYEGGIDGAGTVFRIDKDGTGFTVLQVYIDTPNPGDTDGSPTTPLLFAADGRLYGLTSGGSVAEGTFYGFSPLPVLHLTRNDGDALLSWHACLEEFDLEDSTTPGELMSWKRVETPPEAIGSFRRVTLPRSGEHRFFRLHKP